MSMQSKPATVVNVKVQHIRPQYKDLRDWMEDDDNVYIGRRGVVFIDGRRFPDCDSPFANPFKIDRNTSRDQVISKYREHIIGRINTGALDQKKCVAFLQTEQCAARRARASP